MTGAPPVGHPEKQAANTSDPSILQSIPNQKQKSASFQVPPSTVHTDLPSTQFSLPPRPSAKQPTIPTSIPPTSTTTPSLQNKIGLKMDENLLGKSHPNHKFLLSLLPDPQSAPPNIYGESPDMLATPVHKINSDRIEHNYK